MDSGRHKAQRNEKNDGHPALEKLGWCVTLPYFGRALTCEVGCCGHAYYPHWRMSPPVRRLCRWVLGTGRSMKEEDWGSRGQGKRKEARNGIVVCVYCFCRFYGAIGYARPADFNHAALLRSHSAG